MGAAAVNPDTGFMWMRVSVRTCVCARLHASRHAHVTEIPIHMFMQSPVI